MRKCKCGFEVEYDGYNSIDIVDGYLVIEGDAKCLNCGKEYTYTDDYICDFKNPYNVELNENGAKLQSNILTEGKWSFNGKEWSNECNKCCYDCQELCDEYCEKVFISECMCAGCKYDI